MPIPTTEDGDPELTVLEAAKLMNLHHRTIRNAIRAGELEAFIPRGKDPRRTGRGLGYRIRQSRLQTWFFGPAKVEP